jgi:hypothetical protein
MHEIPTKDVVDLIAFSLKVGLVAYMLMTIAPELAQRSAAHWQAGVSVEAPALIRQVAYGRSEAYYFNRNTNARRPGALKLLVATCSISSATSRHSEPL